MNAEEITDNIIQVDANTALIVGIGVAAVFLFASYCFAYIAAKKASYANSVQKVAEFRQAWINDLRDNMAEFQAISTAPGMNPREDKDFYRVGTKIELLMNPEDKDFTELQNLLNSYLAASGSPLEEKYSLNSPYVEICQGILKREWERLKDDVRNEMI